jgi:plasmid replication initiation protein
VTKSTPEKGGSMPHYNQLTVRKPNALIQARYSFKDVHEYRLYTGGLVELYKGSDPFRMMDIPIETIIGPKDRHLSEKDHENLREASENLHQRIVNLEVYNRKYFDTVPLVYRSTYKEEEQAKGVVRLQFHPEVISVIDDMFEMGYTKWLLMYSNRLRSFYSARMYELLKQYERIGARPAHGEDSDPIPISHLRWWLSLDGEDAKLKRYADFKRRILLKSQEDLRKFTDVQFFFKEAKEFGDPREVKGLWFTINPNIPEVDGSVQMELPLELETASLDNMKKQRMQHYTEGFYGDFVEKVKTYSYDYIEYYYKKARFEEKIPNRIKVGFWSFYKGLLENDPEKFEEQKQKNEEKELTKLKSLQEKIEKEREEEALFAKAEKEYQDLPGKKKEKFQAMVPKGIPDGKPKEWAAISEYMKSKIK